MDPITLKDQFSTKLEEDPEFAALFAKKISTKDLTKLNRFFMASLLNRLLVKAEPKQATGTVATEKVSVFGALHLKLVPARQGKIPGSDEPYTSPPKLVLAFKASRATLARLNQGAGCLLSKFWKPT